MRPAYVAALFLIIGLILVGISMRPISESEPANKIASKTRRRTGTIFCLVATGLLLLDWLG